MSSRDLHHTPGRGVHVTGLGLCLVAALGCAKPDADKGKGGEAPASPETAKQEDKAGEKLHGLTKQQAAQPLAEIGDTVITLGEFAERLASQSPYIRARYASPERRKEFLENMVRFELLAAEAERRGYGKREPVQRLKRQVMVQQLMKTKFEAAVKLSDISDKEVAHYYNAHKEEFHKPEQVRASQLLVKDKRTGAKLLKQALATSKDMGAWRKLVTAHSLDAATKERGGDLRFFSRPEERGPNEPKVPDTVRTAAFTLKRIGDVYPELVQSDQGFHIVKLTSRRAALRRSLEDARRLIQNRLWRERREEKIRQFVAKLREEAEIEEHLELLKEVKVETASARDQARPLQGWWQASNRKQRMQAREERSARKPAPSARAR